MKWNELLSIKKFNLIEDVFKKIGLPKFKLANRAVYYMGNGFLISFSSKMFKVESNNRIEYGEEGEYALSAYFFRNKNDLEAHFKIKNEQFPFEGDILENENFEILKDIEMNSTFEKVTSYFSNQSGAIYYQEGETRAFHNGIFVFQNNFVTWNNYVFFFFGKGRKTKISGFEFTFVE